MAIKRHPSLHKCSCDDDTKKLFIELTSPQIVRMKPGEQCKAKNLFERACWDPLSHAQQSEVGHCIVCLVAQGLLPLENLGASPKSANHVIYRKL